MENAPDPQPQDAKPAVSNRILLASLAILVVGLLAAAAFVFWANDPKYDLKGEPVGTPPATVGTTTPTSGLPEPIPQTAVATTGTAPTSAAPIFGSNDYRRGDSAKLFSGDEVQVWDGDLPTFTIKATQFADSRCPAGVQCIWVGERGLEVEVALDKSGTLPQKLILSETTRKTAQAFGLNLSLIGIDDAKGGTYAEIKFE